MANNEMTVNGITGDAMAGDAMSVEDNISWTTDRWSKEELLLLVDTPVIK